MLNAGLPIIVSLKEAKTRGLKVYFTGIPCRLGHISIRKVVSRSCILCDTNADDKFRKTQKRKEYKIEYRDKNRKKLNDQAKVLYSKNREKMNDRSKSWIRKNRHKVNSYRRDRYKNNEYVKASITMRAMVKRILNLSGREKKLSTNIYLGYSKNELIGHIKSLFLEGMSWSNHGEWHIDHIKPVSLMLKEGEKDPGIINALSNLQPLWAFDNQSKGNKYEPIPR